MKIERHKFTRARINEFYYCDVVPSASDPGVYDFWLRRIDDDRSLYMFGVTVSTTGDISDMIEANVDEYINLFEAFGCLKDEE